MGKTAEEKRAASVVASRKYRAKQDPEKVRAWARQNYQKIKGRVKQYTEKNRERIRQYAYDHYHNGPGKDQHRNKHLKRNHGITILEREAMLEQQGGRCAICGTDKFDRNGPCVDHDHTTGRIRGILCINCNNALGLIKDSALIAKQIIAYLGDHNVD